MAHKDIGKMGSLENSGWQQMQVILDKEMPVQKRDRRLIYWWWMSGAAALIAATIAFNWTTNDNAQTNQPISAIEKIQKPEIKNRQENNFNAEELTQQNSTSNIASEQEINNTENLAFKNTPPSNNSSINIVSKEQSTEYLAPQQSKIINSILNPTAVSVIPELIEIKVTDVSQSKNDIFREERKSYSLMDKIDSRIDPLTTTTKDNGIIPSIILNRTKDNLSLGGKVFSNYSSNSNYTELGLGVFLGIPLSNRIILKSGFDLSIRPNFVNNQTGADFAELASQDNSSSGIQTPTQSVDPVADNNSRLNYYQISVPLKIAYRVGPRFDITAINKVSFTHANQQSLNDLVNSSFAQANASAINSQQWNIHSGIGIDYKVSETVSFGINYLWLLTKNNANPNQINLDLNELEIALMYNLN